MNTLRKKGDIIKNRMSKPKMNLTKRNIIYRVTNCKAKIIMKRVTGTDEYRFDKFRENQNHDLDDTFHLKSIRTLSYSDKEFIVRAFTKKMGATKSHKLKSTLKGGFQHVRRDMGSIIGFTDAQLIVNKMNDRKKNSQIILFIINAMKIRF
uniref:Uncharacterized protein n=1 Tax=Lactuca sativa TaxID=4236 RepID=A0A9R1UYH4_LACSA|nr:hypothetical protein LSAT_V11C700355950 [Lactuca sativa]